MSQTKFPSCPILQFFNINTSLHFEIVVGTSGDFLVCMKRLEGLNYANTNVFNFMWIDELHSTPPNPGQRMSISYVALPCHTPCKCQQTQALHKL